MASLGLEVEAGLPFSLIKVVTDVSVGAEESEMMLWSVGFWVTPMAGVPETAGLGDASPGLHEDPELPVPGAWETGDDAGGSDEAGTVLRMVVSTVRVESAWPGPRVGIESSPGLDVEAGLASSVL